MLFSNFLKIILTEKSAISYLKQENIIGNEKKCPKCRNTMQVCMERMSYRCKKKFVGLNEVFMQKLFLNK
jgi:hypothetical protein